MENSKLLFNRYLDLIEQRIKELTPETEPRELYEPFAYIMQKGGKRIRPILTMACCGAVGGEAKKALNAGVAVEILHNFTLAHDDIMDKSPTRRNRPTIHTKWDEPTAILTGDAMVGLAYQALNSVETEILSEITGAFSQALVDVCEGQAYDMKYNNVKSVTIGEYLTMIEKKTARLLAGAAKIGGYVGGAEEKQLEALENYALNLGLAFQIQDDLLDLVADEKELGKTIGNDIVEGKKTYLIIKALEKAESEQQKNLLKQFIDNNGLSADYVQKMKDMFRELDVFDEAERNISEYFERAKKSLTKLPKNENVELLEWMLNKLNKRNKLLWLF